MFLIDCFAQRLKLIAILICFDFLNIGPPIVLQGNPPFPPPPNVVSVSITFVSFSSEDRETEHDKFINCKLSVTDAVGCTYKKYS